MPFDREGTGKRLSSMAVLDDAVPVALTRPQACGLGRIQRLDVHRGCQEWAWNGFGILILKNCMQ